MLLLPNVFHRAHSHETPVHRFSSSIFPSSSSSSSSSSSTIHVSLSPRSALRKAYKLMQNDNDKRHVFEINKLFHQFQNFVVSTWQGTTQKLQDISGALNKKRRTTRNRLVHSLRMIIPSDNKLSDDYLYGCVDAFLSTSMLCLGIYMTHRLTRRFNTIDDIPISLIRQQRTLKGIVTTVRDGDNLRIKHLPSVIFNPTAKFMKKKKFVSSQETINIRLAAIDAPECAHGLKPGQPYGREARNWLKEYAIGKQVKFKMHSIDQYRRIIATVFIPNENRLLRMINIGRKNVGLELTRAGYATLYKGAGAQYGGEKLLKQYIKAEEIARKKHLGMWAASSSSSQSDIVLPGEFKRMLRNAGVAQTKQMTSQGSGHGKDEKSGLENFVRFLIYGYEWLKRFR